MKRNETIDILKAVGIVLMVLGHCGFSYTKWIYQFHMALFFIVTGYCYNSKHSESIQSIIKLVKSRLVSLYFPCLIFNSTVVLLHNPLVELQIISGGGYSKRQIIIALIKCVLFSGGESLSGAMWFLRTMFISIIIYAVIDYMAGVLTKHCKIKHCKECVKIAVCSVLLFVGWRLYFTPIGKYGNILSVLILCEIGYLIRTSHLNVQWKSSKSLLATIVGFTMVTLLNNVGEIAIHLNMLYNPVYFICCSLFGTGMCYGIASLLEKTMFHSLLAYIGKHTMPIVMFHFAAFKIMTCVLIDVCVAPAEALGASYYVTNSGFWWIGYTIVGVMIPLLVYWGCVRIKNMIMGGWIHKKAP